MPNTTYTTKPNDRWDSISYAAYGDVLKIKTITDANPRVPLYSVLPAGIVLNIPILDETQIKSDSLPPWKR